MPESLEPPVTLDPVILAREIYHLERRLDGTERRVEQIDETGTRGVIGLTIQIQELSKDMGRLEKEMEGLRASTTNTARYWLNTALVVLTLLTTVAFAFLK